MYKPDFEVVKTLPLKKELHYAGDTIESLQFREPTAGLLDVLERTRKGKKPQSDSMVVLAWITGVGIAALKNMCWADTQAALEIVADLTDGDLGEATDEPVEPWEDDAAEGDEGGPDAAGEKPDSD